MSTSMTVAPSCTCNGNMLTSLLAGNSNLHGQQATKPLHATRPHTRAKLDEHVCAARRPAQEHLTRVHVCVIVCVARGERGKELGEACCTHLAPRRAANASSVNELSGPCTATLLMAAMSTSTCTATVPSTEVTTSTVLLCDVAAPQHAASSTAVLTRAVDITIV
jgi:hypothetical protein